jgi:hypothetical protein
MTLILSGFLLVTAGTVLPFLMATRFLEPSLIVLFLAYAASLGGLACGLGVAVSWASGHSVGAAARMSRDQRGS